MKVVLKFAMSLNGVLDKGDSTRSVFSNEEDRKAVSRLRAESDGILIGGGTLRKDNPNLKVYNQEDIKKRIKKGLSPHPMRIVLWGFHHQISDYHNSNLFQDEAFSTTIILHERFRPEAESKIPKVSKVYIQEEQISIPQLLSLIQETTNIETLLVEGGGILGGQFIESGKVDLIRIAYAPCSIDNKDMKKITLPTKSEFRLSPTRSEIQKHGSTPSDSMYSIYHSLTKDGDELLKKLALRTVK